MLILTKKHYILHRKGVREIDFVIPLNKGQKVSAVTSSDVKITDQMYLAEDGVLTFHASVPSMSNAQSTITINFDNTSGITNVQTVNNSANLVKKYLLNNSHIVIESNGKSTM